jgi:hypothetical protein
MVATGLLSTIVTYVHTFSDTLCSKPGLECLLKGEGVCIYLLLASQITIRNNTQ